MANTPIAIVNVDVRFPRNLDELDDVTSALMRLSQALSLEMKDVDVSTEQSGATRMIHASFRGPVVT